MMLCRLRQLNQQQAGQSLIIFALASVFLIALVALAVEGGRAQSDRRFLQAVVDGAALAGGQYLDVDPTASDYKPTNARRTAAKYVFDSLNGGAQSSNPNCSTFSADINPGDCDPDSAHTLTIHTPYNSHPEQIFVRVDNRTGESLGAVIGVTSLHTAAQAVAKKSAGGNPFPFALYVGGNLKETGNVALQVGGNTYVRGCIQLNNSDQFISFAQNGEPGSIEVRDDPAISGSTAKQVWTAGSGTGCNGAIFSRDSYGAAGQNAPGVTPPAGTSAGSCGINDAPGNFAAPCPAGEPPVTDTPPPPDYPHSDPCAAPATPATFTPTGGGPFFARPGCYDACTANNVPANTHFAAGIYGFIGSTCTAPAMPDLIFQGNASYDPSAPNGDTSGGVSFVLTKGAGMCAKSCTAGAGNGSQTCGAVGGVSMCLTFNPPTSGPNRGLLIYACGLTGCGSGGGPIFLKGPGVGIQFQPPSLIFAPASTCSLFANGGQQTFGQIICQDVVIQGGNPSSAEQLFFGGPGLPAPLFDVRLIE